MSRAQRERDRQRKQQARASGSSAIPPCHANNQQIPCLEPSPVRNDLSYSPYALANMIGDGHTEIPDDTITAALNLLKSSCDPVLQPYIGYFKPAEIQYAVNVKNTQQSIVMKLPVPDGQFSVNIHPLPGHWVTSCYSPQTNKVCVYDSLMSQRHRQQVIPQLKIVYGEEKAANVQYCHVTQQGSEPLCGVMAICFAFSLCLGKDPEMIEFNTAQAREHLRQCFLRGEMCEFPGTAKNVHLNSHILFPEGGNLYFSYLRDQTERAMNHQLKLSQIRKQTEDVAMGQNKRRRLVSLNDRNLQTQKDKVRKQISRSGLSESEKNSIKDRDKYRKRTARSQMDSDKKIIYQEKNTQRKSAIRSEMSPSERIISQAKDKERKCSERSQMDASKKIIYQERNTQRKSAVRSEISPSERVISKAKDKERKTSGRSQMDSSKKIIYQEKNTKRKSAVRSEMSPSERVISQAKDKERKCSERSQMDSDKKIIYQEKNTQRKSAVRSEMSPSERVISQAKDKERKCSERSQMDSSKKIICQEKNTKRKSAVRSEMSPSERVISQAKDKERKCSERSQMDSNKKIIYQEKNTKRKSAVKSEMSPSERVISQERDKQRKSTLRSEMSPSERVISQTKDKERKSSGRSQMGSSKRMISQEREKQRKSTVRSEMSPSERTLYQAKDKRRKCVDRSQMDANKKVTITEKESRLRKQKRTEALSENDAIEEFNKSVSLGPVYVCASCLRLLYKQSVIEFKRTKYDAFVTNVTSTQYPCSEKIWICNTCHKHLLKGKLPPQNFTNNLQVDEIPEELSILTSLEGHLISQRIPFMKIMSRPRGGQKAISGAVVNVPIDCSDTCKNLPRPPPNSCFIMLKLKRKLEYKSAVVDQVIRPATVRSALKSLIQINPLYKDIEENENAFSIQSDNEDKDMWDELLSDQTENPSIRMCLENVQEKQADNDLLAYAYTKSDKTIGKEVEEVASEKVEVEETLNEQLNTEEVAAFADNSEVQRNDGNESEVSEEEDLQELDREKGIPLDTCLQPTECQGNEIVSIAPAEGNQPISVLNDPHAELLAFPVLFPQGRFGFSIDRGTQLHFRKYLNARLLNIDTRFASNIDYIFFMQFLAEKKQIVDNIQIALRKSQCSDIVTAATIRSSDTLKTFIAKDLAYTILKNIRGSPAYWQKCMYDLLGMVRQLGLFTWFLTLSSADLRWTDTIRIIAQQSGVHLTDKDINNLSWEQKCKWIRNNPVTAARHFDFKVQQFFKIIIQKNKALGDVTDFFIRTEFQQRGSPHVHCVLWVKDAPVVGVQSHEEICTYIDKYICCTLPSDDEDLHLLVSTLQKHSHTRTCKKGGQFCRFHFPKPPVPYTIMVKEEDLNNNTHPSNNPPDQAAQQSSELPTVTPAVNYKDIFITVQQYIQQFEEKNPGCTLSLNDVLQACGVSENLYVECLKNLQTGTKILHKREPEDKYINNYNPTVLKAWQANMDLQYVTDAYSCIMYIVSYVTKDERELSDVLRQASRQACNQSIRQQLRQLGNVFLNHREISAQEAIYRALPLPLRRTSRSVVFVPTDEPDDRVKLVKPASAIEHLDDDDEEVFSTSIINRYIARPQTLKEMTLAEFSSHYTVKSYVTKEDFLPEIMEHDQQMDGKVITLKNGKGQMTKRTKKAIIRTHVFSKLKQPEKYFRSKLMLYVPWTDENELKLGFSTFKEAYDQLEKQIHQNMQQFEHNSEIVDNALQEFEENGPLVDVWDSINSETLQRNEDDLHVQPTVDPDAALINPDFYTGIGSVDIRNDVGASTLTYSVKKSLLKDEDARQLIRQTNAEQREVFTEILRWCRQYSQCKKDGNLPPPFYIFITGGAGTGKSFLIKAIYNTAVRELQGQGDSSSDCTVLLTAPTGTAAFNIDGMTIHSALKLPIKQHRRKHEEYTPLSQEKLHDLRCKLINLTILIIDEISMVSSQDLYNIHRRLCDIKGTSDASTYFGGVSILAVGDLWQIPPVAAKPVYSLPNSPLARLAGSLWENLFQIHHLETIMRQKDDIEFANILNRVRNQTQTDNDIKVLESRIIQPDDPCYPHDAIHIFPTNSAVDKHNATKLASLKMPLTTLIAIDLKPDNSPLPEKLNLPDNPALTGGLHQTLNLCKGARVMITKNIDVSDGLVNGTQGVVLDFWSAQSNEIKAVIVKCDQQKSGSQSRLKYPQMAQKYPEGIPIFREEVHIQMGTTGVLRQQFPLRLSWACTVHKTQGMTLPQAVVSIEGRFGNGQAYVALSRVTSINGLFLLKFDRNKIKGSKEVSSVIKNMDDNKFFIPQNPIVAKPSNVLSVALQNTRSFVRHEEDIRFYPDINTVDILCFTETWLKRQKTPIFPHMCPFRQDRSHKRSGGVIAYVRNDMQSSCLQTMTNKHADLLLFTVEVDNRTVYLILMYCANDGNNQEIIKCINEISLKIPSESLVVLLGDFNKANIASAHIYKSLYSVIDSATFKSGSTLDQVYTNW